MNIIQGINNIEKKYWNNLWKYIRGVHLSSAADITLFLIMILSQLHRYEWILEFRDSGITIYLSLL